MTKRLFPMNLQFFAEPGGEGAGGTPQNDPPANNEPTFDYEKLANMIAGKQTATEDHVLRGYFKQQGLSKEEADQAMAAFKQQKAANQPDVGAIQTQLTQAQTEAQQARVESAATMAAVGLGISANTIPYVLKMADLSQAVGQDGKINEETIKNALNKVLEDVPALKPQAAGTTGFQLGSPGQQGQQSATDDALKAAFGL